MYEAFFHLKGKPFELLPDPEYLYLSPAHRKAISYLEYGIRERAGFILLTGEVGSGKTTIIKNIVKGLDAGVRTSKIFTTNVTPHQLLALINDDFGLESAGRDKVALFKDLYDFLIREFVAGRHCLLLIDEAQNLSSECLEEVRMLSNLETENAKLLQIILVGQPELRTILAANDLRQLRQRISINCHITPLDREQTEAYILHRLERAGNRDALSFPPECFDIIQDHTRGIPRLINIMCDFLLLTAFVDGVHTLTGEVVREVAADLQFDCHYWSSDSAGDAPVVKSVTPSPRPDELTLLVQRIDARLDSLERVAADPARHTEWALLAERCAHLEESILKLQPPLHGEVRQNAAQFPDQLPDQLPTEQVRHYQPDAKPDTTERRWHFFRSLFGRP